MNKKTKFKLNETLDKALSPPKKTRNLKALDTLLHQFDDGKGITPNLVRQNLNPPTQTRPRPDPDQTQTITNTGKISDSKKKPTINRMVLQSKNISPVRDYNKRANSLERDALPAGLFSGASKSIYDSLYIRTIGAIAPKKIIQATRKELMEWSGIKNIKTINAHLKRLKDIGLVKATNFVGEQKGAFYEVFLPEEIDQPDPDQTQTRPDPDQTQKLVLDPDQKTDWAGLGKGIETKDTYSSAKTSLKTNTIDDESPLAETLKMLNEAAKRATGKDLTAKDFEALKDIVEIIISETDLVRTRTHSVSVYLKLAAENLRRRLYAKKTGIKAKNAPDEKNWVEVGKNQEEADEYDEQGNYIPRPLDEKGRWEALKVLREYQSWEAPVEDSKRFYTAEDWQWLMENLRLEEEKDKEKD